MRPQPDRHRHLPERPGGPSAPRARATTPPPPRGELGPGVPAEGWGEARGALPGIGVRSGARGGVGGAPALPSWRSWGMACWGERCPIDTAARVRGGAGELRGTPAPQRGGGKEGSGGGRPGNVQGSPPIVCLALGAWSPCASLLPRQPHTWGMTLRLIFQRVWGGPGDGTLGLPGLPAVEGRVGGSRHLGGEG